MAISPLVLSVHLLIFIVDAVSVYYDLFLIDLGNTGFGGKFKFLTVWNICFQAVYFGLCVISDLYGNEKTPLEHARRSVLLKVRDFLHTTVAFPMGMFVVVTFWILYAVDRELVYPKSLDSIIPSWLNHVLHTTVMPFLLVDKLLVYHHHPRKHVGILGAGGVALIYISWILFIAYYDNFWVYPILQILQTSERVVFIFVCFMFFASIYILGESITAFLWPFSQQRKRVFMHVNRNEKMWSFGF
ncbi:unnamed protein product [Candidula unifasciata]|uniref:Androgen-dependent TFPI-regulating protein n=1 Tax=Candidula unifasciata TaxID=100452 RepID=A0A8S3YGH4_9EUPU|nr:unnamed protein product [Candidula unifasciata]